MNLCKMKHLKSKQLSQHNGEWLGGLCSFHQVALVFLHYAPSSRVKLKVDNISVALWCNSSRHHLEMDVNSGYRAWMRQAWWPSSRYATVGANSEWANQINNVSSQFFSATENEAWTNISNIACHFSRGVRTELATPVCWGDLTLLPVSFISVAMLSQIVLQGVC